jgi:hypothetical protein
MKEVTCLKCGAVAQFETLTEQTACPACGAIYAKVLGALRKKREQQSTEAARALARPRASAAAPPVPSAAHPPHSPHPGDPPDQPGLSGPPSSVLPPSAWPSSSMSPRGGHGSVFAAPPGRAASWPLRIAYAGTVLSVVLPIGIASSSWVSLATGGNWFRWLNAAVPMLFVALALYRVYLVLRWSGTLALPHAGRGLRLLRGVGAFLLYVGLLFWLVSLAASPLLAAYGPRSDRIGIVPFVVGVMLAQLGSLGMVGLLLFEMGRLRSFEQHWDAPVIEASA